MHIQDEEDSILHVDHNGGLGDSYLRIDEEPFLVADAAPSESNEGRPSDPQLLAALPPALVLASSHAALGTSSRYQ